MLLVPVFRDQIIKRYLWYVDLDMTGLVINRLVLVKRYCRLHLDFFSGNQWKSEYIAC